MPIVKCANCGSDIVKTHDELRALIEQDRPPACKVDCAPSVPTGQFPPAEVKLIARDYPLLALDVFERGGYVTTPRGVLVMAVWRVNPELFGLEGFKNVAPDAKRVDAELFRLVNFKLTTRPFQNSYRLAPAGLERLAYLRAHAKTTAAKAVAAIQGEAGVRRP